jgi:transcription termination factor NusB
MTKISRKKSRKFLFQKLFSDSFNKNSDESFSKSFLIESFKDNLDEHYLSEMFDIVREKEYFSLYILEKYAPKFDLKNMDLTYVLPIFI